LNYYIHIFSKILCIITKKKIEMISKIKITPLAILALKQRIPFT